MKTTKGGKVMNPTDAYRKELRKKELKRVSFALLPFSSVFGLLLFLLILRFLNFGGRIQLFEYLSNSELEGIAYMLVLFLMRLG